MSDEYLNKWLGVEWIGWSVFVIGLYYWFGLGVALATFGLLLSIEGYSLREELE